MGLSYHIQLLDNDEIISDPKEVVERATWDLDDEKFIENSINKSFKHKANT